MSNEHKSRFFKRLSVLIVFFYGYIVYRVNRETPFERVGFYSVHFHVDLRQNHAG